MLHGKKIILGITGSIAAYKSCFLVRLLVKEGATVKVILTPSAHGFVTPTTLSALSGNPVLTDFVQNTTGEWNNHVDLGLWADALVIAPASANTLAHMANGACNNLLLSVYLSARCPVFFAPAMDLDMLQHPATLRNIDTLCTYGNHQIAPTFGELASGLTGTGRMEEPEKILEHLRQYFAQAGTLNGKSVLVTAGPTFEAIDPVRFIGNHSSGKMGFALAEAFASRGANVNLVTGPTALHTAHRGINVIPVTSAEDMYKACTHYFPGSDIAVLAAAVADYKPVDVATQKIKKDKGNLNLELTRTHDIASSLGTMKRKGQILVGFALETENEVPNAKRKLEAKNLDLIVLNSLNDAGAGFRHDTNQVILIDRENGETKLGLKSKKETAVDIVNAIIQRLYA